MAPARARPFGPFPVLVGLLVAVLLASPLLIVGGAAYLLGVVIVGAILLVLAVGRRRSAGPAEGRGSGVWSAIPPWQYAGRHAESGGLSRQDQERALAEVREQADRLEDR
jgi:hypothetical protein